MGKNRQKFSDKSIFELQERLSGYSFWYPLPCIISYFLSLLFIGYVLSNINPRLGHTADVLPFKTAHAFDDSIWASVILRNGVLRVTTEDRKHFSWNALSKNIDDVREFSEYLKNRVLEITVSASLSKKVTLGQTHVILAVDQNLNYAHIKPIIYALAEAGISDYAFETKNVQ